MDESVLGVLWTREVGDLHPVLAREGLVVLAGPGRLMLVEADTGFELWELDVPGEQPAVIAIDGDELNYFVEYRHLVIDVDLGEVIEERALETHAGERPDALPARPSAQPDGAFVTEIGRFVVTVARTALVVAATGAPEFAATVDVHPRHDLWPAVSDPDAARGYVVLTDGSLWCLTADGSGTPVDPGGRSRATALVDLVDALHVRGTDPLGLRARLGTVSEAGGQQDVVLDWVVRRAAALALDAAEFTAEAEQLGDLGSLVGWELLPEEASAFGEILSPPWEQDLDRRAGEEAGVIWTLLASAVVGGHAVASRAVLLVERSRVLASHPAELPLLEVGGAFPYLVAGTEAMDDDSRREVDRLALGLLAAATAARCADLLDDPDLLLNEIRASGFELVEDVVGS